MCYSSSTAVAVHTAVCAAADRLVDTEIVWYRRAGVSILSCFSILNCAGDQENRPREGACLPLHAPPVRRVECRRCFFRLGSARASMWGGRGVVVVPWGVR